MVQYLGTTVPGDLSWDGASWTSDTATLFDDTPPFAVELNVGGKYIWGASSGGWVPDFNGFYRITFYAPSGSGVNMTTAITADAATGYLPSADGAAHGQIDTVNNLAYIDVEVGGEGGGGGE